MLKYLVFDLETTGLDYNTCAIIQFSGYIVQSDENNNFKIIDKFDYKIKPHNDAVITPASLNITKLSMDQIMKFPSSATVFTQFLELLNKHVDTYNSNNKLFLVGYNSLHFDHDFLKNWFALHKNKYFFTYFWSNGIDILSEASRYFTYYRPAFPNFKLGTVAEALDLSIDFSKLHNSKVDATLTLQMFVKLMRSDAILKWNENTAIELYKKLNKKEN